MLCRNIYELCCVYVCRYVALALEMISAPVFAEKSCVGLQCGLIRSGFGVTF